jgi:hypothetical protein
VTKSQDSGSAVTAVTRDCDPERLVYRERLRQLAEGQDNGKSGSAPAQAAKRCEAERAKSTSEVSRGASALPQTAVPPTQPKVEEPGVPAAHPAEPTQVSTRGTTAAGGAANAEQNSKLGTAENGASDKVGSTAYQDSLRRISNGQLAPPQTSSNLIASRNLTTERNFIKNLAFDQMHIWASPFKLRDSDATWAVPFGIATGALIATDHDTSKQLAKPSRIDISKKISDAGLFGAIGAGAGFYGLGLMTHDDHKRETGLLTGEAVINAALVAEGLKYAFGRQRPFEADHFGHIGKDGSSFPSGHAIDTWAAATVIAHEYPTPLVQIGAYGLATAVAATRVTAGQHFPSDVLVGSTFGYLIGRKIYNDHHDPELGGAEYGTFVHDRKRDAEHSGSSYVPLESWVYPVIDRLAALGFVHSNFDSERPFTRLECARLAAEAQEKAESDEVSVDVRSMIQSLQQEFARESEVWAGNSENRSAELESVYTRTTEIAGPVLRDGYHFGQTVYDDYGRPYGRGLNEITGFSARATSGPLVFYFRGEYQHAPANPNYTTQQKDVIFLADDQTPPVDNRFPAADRFQALDAYIGITFSNNLLTLGQQSLWWGPGSDGAFMFSNNAAPFKMIRLNRTSPIEIPLLSRLLGPLRYDMFLGQTDGYQHILTAQGLVGPHLGTQPFIQGQRFTFKPTPNFEFGLTRTDVFGGSGYPLTAGYFFRTTFTTANYLAGAARKPGDRRSGVDVAYRIPKLRNWLTWYAEEFSEDEVSPLFFPRTSAMRSGIYAAKLPGLPRVDLRVEGVYTDIPSYGALGYFYFNATYKDGFTNNGNIMGNWIGRDGRGVSGTSTIWLSARNSLQVGYRQGVVDPEFDHGGRYQDELLKANFSLRRGLGISAMLQYENWRFPLLAPGLQTNVTSSVQITYQPKGKK